MELQLASVENLKKEIKSHIAILKSSETKPTANEKTYKKIASIIDIYLYRSPEELIAEDVINFSVKDIKAIMTYILTENENDVESKLESLISPFELNVSIYKTTNNENKKKELLDYFEMLRKIIVDYIEEYKTITDNRNELENSKEKEYSRVLEVLSKDYPKIITDEDIENIVKLSKNFGLSEDLWSIKEYIFKHNLDIIKLEIIKPNINKKVSDITLEYLSDSEDAELVKKETERIILENNLDSLDIDSISTIAKEICNNTGIPENVVTNILASLAINTLFTKLKENDSNDTKEMIEQALGLFKPEYDNSVILARGILEMNCTLYKNVLLSGANFDFFVTHTIEELVDYTNSNNRAIELKIIPILKAMSETIDRIEMENITEEEYQEACELLDELIAEYDKYMNQKKKKRKR